MGGGAISTPDKSDLCEGNIRLQFFGRLGAWASKRIHPWKSWYS